MSAPESLSNLLNSVLSENKYNNAKVDLNPINTGGANYTSGLYEVTVTQEHKDTLHLFAKVAIMSENVRQDTFPMYKIENKIYRTLGPAFDEIQNKHGIPEDDRFNMPKFYGSSLELGNETFIFENLNAKGYKIYDRFDTKDVRLPFDTVTALAKFHALGLVLNKEQPQLYQKFGTKEFVHFIDKFVDAARNHVDENMEKVDEHYRAKIKKILTDDIYEKYRKLFTCKGNILIHGDFRASNIMYKKQDNKVIVVPVDYQCVRQGGPISDLFYFIVLSTDEAFRVKHFDELIEHYHNELTLFLSKLGVDVNDEYPKKVFLEEVKELLPATIPLALMMIPLVLVESAEAPNFAEENLDMDQLFIKANSKSTERINGYLKDCVRWGII